MEVEDRFAMYDLYARYDQLFDDGDRAGWIDLFTFDSVRRVLMPDETGVLREVSHSKGREALESYWDARQGQYEGSIVRHYSSDVLLDGEGAVAQGRVSSMVVLYQDGTPHIVNTGRIVDDLVRQDGVWRFRTRTIRPDGWGGVSGRPFGALCE